MAQDAAKLIRVEEPGAGVVFAQERDIRLMQQLARLRCEVEDALEDRELAIDLPWACLGRSDVVERQAPAVITLIAAAWCSVVSCSNLIRAL